MRLRTLSLLFFFSLLSLVIYQSMAANYCSARLCRGKKHIACGNKGGFAGRCSNSARIQKLNNKLRQAILRQHNQLRNKIARGNVKRFKPAIRMAPLRWNNELAKLAALNVKQCKMAHDKCRSTNKFRYAGQNLAMFSTNGKIKGINTVNRQMINAWFNEYKDCSMSYIKSYRSHTKGKAIGHFTQMVSEKSTHVGCAVLRESKQGKRYHYLACNYAYTNVNGRPVYRSGRAASACKTGRHRRYRYLCSSNEVYKVNNIKAY